MRYSCCSLVCALAGVGGERRRSERTTLDTLARATRAPIIRVNNKRIGVRESSKPVLRSLGEAVPGNWRLSVIPTVEFDSRTATTDGI